MQDEYGHPDAQCHAFGLAGMENPVEQVAIFGDHDDEVYPMFFGIVIELVHDGLPHYLIHEIMYILAVFG